MGSEHDRAGARRDFLPPALLKVGPTIAFAVVFATLILGAVIALATLGDHPFKYYSIDPARSTSASPLVGLMSHTGVLLAWGAAVICVFAGVFVARARSWRHATPLLVLGVGVAYLAVDDLFLFHEDIYPDWLGLPQKLVLIAYAVGALAFFWWYRDFFRKQELPLLVLALAGLGMALALDFELRRLLVHEGLKRWMEDTTKLFGLALFAAYLVRLSARMLADAYPTVSAERSDEGTDSRRETEVAIVGTNPIGDEA